MRCRHEREEYREDKKKINQRGGSVKTRELTCGATRRGLLKETLAKRARQATGERIPPHVDHPRSVAILLDNPRRPPPRSACCRGESRIRGEGQLLEWHSPVGRRQRQSSDEARGWGGGYKNTAEKTGCYRT
jgi:hypothetical protein